MGRLCRPWSLQKSSVSIRRQCLKFVFPLSCRHLLSPATVSLAEVPGFPIALQGQSLYHRNRR